MARTKKTAVDHSAGVKTATVRKLNSSKTTGRKKEDVISKLTRKRAKTMLALQSTAKNITPRSPMEKVVREIMQDIAQFKSDDKKIERIQKEALHSIQEAAEMFVSDLFGKANKAAKHAKRVTVMPKDLLLVNLLTGFTQEKPEYLEDQARLKRKPNTNKPVVATGAAEPEVAAEPDAEDEEDEDEESFDGDDSSDE